MRRVLFAIGGLAASTTLLVVVKGSPAATPVAQNGAAGRNGAPSASAAGGSPGPQPRPDASGKQPPPAAGGKPAGKAPAGAKTTAAAPKPPSGPFKVTGSVASNEYGNVQVQLTMTGRDITAVSALEMPESTADSTRRSASVKSAMGRQAVQRDSANLDTVSGATATSDSYRQSLQAALDRAARGERD